MIIIIIIIKLKNATIWKFLLERFKSILDQTKDSISTFVYRSLEIIQADEHKDKRMKESEGSLRNLYDIIKWTNMHFLEVLQTEEINGQEAYSRK